MKNKAGGAGSSGTSSVVPAGCPKGPRTTPRKRKDAVDPNAPSGPLAQKQRVEPSKAIVSISATTEGERDTPSAEEILTGGAAGASIEESDDELIKELTASPPPVIENLEEDLEDDPQLTAENIKKFQKNVREFHRFSVQLSNRSHLKSLRMKDATEDLKKLQKDV
ncbi:uncharacterized protein LOC120639141 isoform X2 [Panicum virgatum]|uniref:uncharacterized protein LOC120639141 isoform X2 n=1 Tax=Panicum virgatum TaxID=38727 RepID=UPI0019D56A86|nr:uncharacterized protein LOC120639141 isoform X2 [Panicum virgatum]